MINFSEAINLMCHDEKREPPYKVLMSNAQLELFKEEMKIPEDLEINKLFGADIVICDEAFKPVWNEEESK